MSRRWLARIQFHSQVAGDRARSGVDVDRNNLLWVGRFDLETQCAPEGYIVVLHVGNLRAQLLEGNPRRAGAFRMYLYRRLLPLGVEVVIDGRPAEGAGIVHITGIFYPHLRPGLSQVVDLENLRYLAAKAHTQLLDVARLLEAILSRFAVRQSEW
jgi:hypothetical protein